MRDSTSLSKQKVLFTLFSRFSFLVGSELQTACKTTHIRTKNMLTQAKAISITVTNIHTTIESTIKKLQLVQNIAGDTRML